jgi:hypothetical protein
MSVLDIPIDEAVYWEWDCGQRNGSGEDWLIQPILVAWD